MHILLGPNQSRCLTPHAVAAVTRGDVPEKTAQTGVVAMLYRESAGWDSWRLEDSVVDQVGFCGTRSEHADGKGNHATDGPH
jgi:hypothetical protein